MPRGVKKAGVVAQQLQVEMQGNQIAPSEQATPPSAKPPKPEPKKKQRVETILIRHDFTTLELANLGKSLADKERVAVDIEAEAKACARQYKDKLANVTTEISNDVNKLKEGFEMVPVECIVMAKIDRTAKTVTKVYYRKDTGAYIKHEDALNVELELFNILPGKGDITKALDGKFLKEQV